MLSIWLTENSGVKSFPSATFFWNGSERPVATVPGCSPTTSVPWRLSSSARLRVTMFCAALEIRYEYQPPRRLSLTLPTRALRFAMMDCGRPLTPLVLIIGASACASSSGAIVFMRKLYSIHSGVTALRLRSGMVTSSASSVAFPWRMPATLRSMSTRSNPSPDICSGTPARAAASRRSAETLGLRFGARATGSALQTQRRGGAPR
mmetsp:Transcript_22062/g.67757  ORF Transcript_22062/g.67757 Transcript_22062/m.67757 type:complete len:206 (-) Transcript_22062:55-672(-)